MAANFVPELLRRVNEWHVAARLTAVTANNDAGAATVPKRLLVPFVPVCHCRGTTQISANQPLHVFPIRAIPSDLYFAVQNRAALIRPDVVAEPPLAATNGEKARAPPTPRPASLPSVDSISSLDDYRSAWGEILALERNEVLLRYENYSQYAKPVRVQASDHPRRAAQGAQSASDGGTLCQAIIDVQGVADASPPLTIGDIVLVRPMDYVSLPLPPLHHPPRPVALLKGAHWSPPIGAEVTATVLSVQRGSPSDKVIMSWLNKFESDVLLQALQYAAKGKGYDSRTFSFNVRFVPAAARHERCLTALDWFGETYKENPRAAMELLFPVTAPAISFPASELALNDILAHSKNLNDKQCSFVSMALARTQYPSTDEVRPPMVLTGPAGTGPLNNR